MGLLTEKQKQVMSQKQIDNASLTLAYPSFGGVEDQRVKIFSERGFSQNSSLEKSKMNDSILNIDPYQTQVTQPDETNPDYFAALSD